MKLLDVRKDLIYLRGNIVANPQSYEDDFVKYYNYFESCANVFKLHPMRRNDNLINLAFFICEMSKFYKSHSRDFGNLLLELMKANYSICHFEIRAAFYKCAMILFNNGLLRSKDIIDLSFLLLTTNDKNIRTIIRTYLVKHVKDVLKDQNRTEILSNICSTFHKKITDHKDENVSRIAFDVLCKLFSTKVLQDAKIANIIAEACFSKDDKIAFKAVLFALGKDNLLAQMTDSDQNCDETELAARVERKKEELISANKALKSTKIRMKFNIKSYSKKKALLKMEKECKNKKSEVDDLCDENDEESGNLRVIDKIFDTYKFCEQLLEQIHKRHVSQSFRIIEFELLANIIFLHSLIFPDFFSLIQMNIKLGRKESTKYMYFAALAVHKEVPEYVIENLVHCIAFNFVSEGNRSDQIAYGLNTIRQIAIKNSNGISKDMLDSLLKFGKIKDKTVSSAARSLINAIQKCDPTKLPKKYSRRVKKEPVMSDNDENSMMSVDSSAEDIDENQEMSDDEMSESSVEDNDLDDSDESETEEDKKVTLNDIEGIRHSKKQKSDQSIRQNINKEKCQAKYKHWRMNPNASTTNREKQKKKSFGMVGQKMRLIKAKKSLHQKCVEMKTKLKRERKFKNKL
ncbi:MAG: Protein SDA1 [Marteilia pararefringens]